MELLYGLSLWPSRLWFDVNSFYLFSILMYPYPFKITINCPSPFCFNPFIPSFLNVWHLILFPFNMYAPWPGLPSILQNTRKFSRSNFILKSSRPPEVVGSLRQLDVGGSYGGSDQWRKEEPGDPETLRLLAAPRRNSSPKRNAETLRLRCCLFLRGEKEEVIQR